MAFTRKQAWRRVRTRKSEWSSLPPEVIEMMTREESIIRKSSSWQDGGELQQQQQQPASSFQQGPGLMPRSVSCSSLSSRRSLFGPDRLSPKIVQIPTGTTSSGLEECCESPSSTYSSETGGSGPRDSPSSKSVSFDARVRMVLIPQRQEMNDIEKQILWWTKDNYSQFRQVLVRWKEKNAHLIKAQDNILSINLSDIDDEDFGSHNFDPANCDDPAQDVAENFEFLDLGEEQQQQQQQKGPDLAKSAAEFSKHYSLDSVAEPDASSSMVCNGGLNDRPEWASQRGRASAMANINLSLRSRDSVEDFRKLEV